MKKIKKTNPSISSLIKIKWIDGMQFVATDSAGHSILMDASKEYGGEGSGFSPMQLLLIALGGCTSMDVVHILKKQRQQINDLEVLVSGERVKEPPQVYNKILVEYKIKGTDIKEKAIQRAIQLSEEKYCSVGAMLKAKAKIASKYIIKKDSL